jgi:hypothetical protein
VSAPANPVGAIRYVFKDLADESKKMLPPPWWKGRVIYGPTKGFLIRPSDDLWSEVKADWYGDKAL